MKHADQYVGGPYTEPGPALKIILDHVLNPTTAQDLAFIVRLMANRGCLPHRISIVNRRGEPSDVRIIYPQEQPHFVNEVWTSYHNLRLVRYPPRYPQDMISTDCEGWAEAVTELTARLIHPDILTLKGSR